MHFFMAMQHDVCIEKTRNWNSKQPKQVGSKRAVAAFTPVLVGASLSSGSDDRPNWRGANIAPSQMDYQGTLVEPDLAKGQSIQNET